MLNIIALSVKPLFGSSVPEIFKFTGPGRTSVVDEKSKLLVIASITQTWFNDFGKPIPDRLRGTVGVGDPRHPAMAPGFGYIATVLPLDGIKRDVMLIIPGDPIIENTRTSN